MNVDFLSPQKANGASGSETLPEKACLHLLFFGIGALLGSAELLFGVYPFGLALAAAAEVMFPAVALGVALFSFLTKSYLSAATLGILALLRLGLSLVPEGHGRRSTKPPLFGERVGFRVLAAMLAVFATALYRLLGSNFRYYELFGLLLGVLATGLSTLLLCGLFQKKDRLFPYSQEAGLAALLLMGIFAMRNVSFIGIYPSATAAALISFLLAAHFGIPVATAGGLLSGLCFHATLSPAFLLAGVAFGLLEKSSRGGAVLAGGGIAAAYAFAVSGIGGMTLLLPALLAAGALFLAVDSAGLVTGAPAHRRQYLLRRTTTLTARAACADVQKERFEQISKAFSELSTTLYDLGTRQRRPGLPELRNLCDKCFDKVCPKCRNRDVCWGSEYNATAAAVTALGSRLYANGTVERGDVPASLAARCRDLAGVLEDINTNAERVAKECLCGDKTSVVAMDYAAIARVLGDTLEGAEEDLNVDTATGERIVARLVRMGYSVESVCVCGKGQRRVLLRDIRLPGRHLKIRELRQVLEQYCHFPLGEAEILEANGGQDVLFLQKKQFLVSTVKESRAKKREGTPHCGDSTMSVSAPNRREYVFLCDGMGSGSSAALTSALSATFLSQFLRAGNRAETSLKMLNGFLAARGHREHEASTTVDLLEIDTVTGEASLIKCGAAPSFLLRGGTVTRFFSRTAPAGILDTLDAERLSFSVEAGDVILQISDGVSGGEEDCPFLTELLKTKWEGDAEAFARLILNHATTDGCDDLSVVITKIGEA